MGEQGLLHFSGSIEMLNSPFSPVSYAPLQGSNVQVSTNLSTIQDLVPYNRLDDASDAVKLSLALSASPTHPEAEFSNMLLHHAPLNSSLGSQKKKLTSA